MGAFKIDEKTRNDLEKAGRKMANKLADDAKEKLVKKYISLINDYYEDYTPKVDKHGIPYYQRTLNLFNSYRPYKKNPHNTIYYGGVQITADKMYDYESISGEPFAAQSLLDKFIYTKDGTWHGGDWHGGYGVKAKFSISGELLDYRDYLVQYYTKKYSVK
jgi:hypothetical protein